MERRVYNICIFSLIKLKKEKTNLKIVLIALSNELKPYKKKYIEIEYNFSSMTFDGLNFIGNVISIPFFS